MKKLFLLPLLAAVAFSACKKSDDSSTPQPPPNTNPYYFRFTMNNSNYDLNGTLPQYMPFYTNEVGGYQVASTLYPMAGLRLSWPVNDTVTEAGLMSLVGQTLYFDGAGTVHPEVSFSTDATSDTWYSIDTANTNYNVKITNISYLKNDTAINPLRVYVITGTCNAVLSDGISSIVMSNGSFNFRVSKRDL